jgi:CheY-like chemotaxis protein
MRAGTPDGIGLQADPHRPISIGSRLDHDIHECRALVIDGNPTSRSVLTAQLRDFGVGTVVQTGRVKDARSILENRPFDVVLCDYHFDGSDMSGQDLLDELRREQLLPFATVFIMVTGEATDAKVTEAAESALDGSLLKPHTATHLGERIRESRQRKRVLRHIFEAIERGDHGAAAELCQARFEKRAPCWLYAAHASAPSCTCGWTGMPRRRRCTPPWWRPAPCPGPDWASPARSSPHLHEKKVAEAVRGVRGLTDEVDSAAMDMEAACSRRAVDPAELAGDPARGDACRGGSHRTALLRLARERGNVPCTAQNNSPCADAFPGGRNFVRSSSTRVRLNPSRAAALAKRWCSSWAHTPSPFMRAPKRES